MKTKLLKKLVTYTMVLVTLIGSILTSVSVAQAASLLLDEKTGYSYTGFSPILGEAITHKNIFIMKVDGKKTFCVESGIHANSGEGYVPEEYIDAKKDRLSKIAYYGFTSTAQTNYDYAITQVIIWGELGDQMISTSIPNFHERKAEILEMVDKHDVLPSWHDNEVTVEVGKSITLEDANGVFHDMKMKTNATNTQLSMNGNALTITPNANSNNGMITFQKIDDSYIGTSIVYKKPNEQTLVEFHLDSTKETNVKVNVIKLGNVRIQKIDEDTGKALPNTTIKFEYNGTSKEVVTDANGYASINDIPEGTVVTITEVLAPDGYYNKGEIKTVTVKPNDTITVVLGNKEQLGQVLLQKTGQAFGTTMFNQYYSLENAVYGIYTKQGVKVGTMTTDQSGKAISEPLKLGEYYAVEEKAPEGYLLNPEKIPFTLAYAGQMVEITSTDISQTEQEQKGSATLIKEDEKTGSVPQGSATLDGAVYELHRTLNDELVSTITIKNGKTVVKDLYLDDYYWLEVKAPEGYQLDQEKHHFKLSYAGENVETALHTMTVKEQVITGNFDLIKFGTYDWMTIFDTPFANKEAKPLKDVEFSVFSDTTNKLVKKGLTDASGYLKFTDLPYDTYTVKETKTPEGYIPAKEFKVTISEQEQTFHYMIENKVIEEKLKVIKIDEDTGNAIPRAEAGFQIRHVGSGNLVTMPKQNEDGVTDIFYTNQEGYLITPEALPYGDYELIEVQAPQGYVMAKEPVTFKVDGTNNGLIEIYFKNKSQKIEPVEARILPMTGDQAVIADILILICIISLGSIMVLYDLRKKSNK